jgi:iron complex outermembrane receptor protein
MAAWVTGSILLFCGWTLALPGESKSTEAEEVPPYAGTETIEVEGEGRIAGDAPTSFVTVIRPADYAGRVTTLADLLDRSVGVRVRSFGGLRSFATISIRGSSAEQVIVMVDGVPLNNPAGGGVDLTSIPLTGVESVEIHRGFSPASSGSSSIGGVVNIRTLKPSGIASASGSLAYGTHETSEITGLVNLPGSFMNWTLGAEAFASQGDFKYLSNNGTPLTNLDDSFEVRKNNDGWDGAFRFHGRTSARKNRQLFLTGEWARRRHGVPGIDAFQFANANTEMNRALIRGGQRWQELGGRKIDLELSLDYAYHSEFYSNLGPNSPARTDSWTRIQGTGAKAHAVWKITARHRLSLLAEPRTESVTSGDHLLISPAVKSTRQSLKTSFEDEIRLARGRLILAPSVRLDLVDTSSRGGAPGSATEPSEDPSALSGRLGGMFIISDRWSLRGNVGRFHRYPNLLELYGNQGTIAGNPSLQPERGLNGDMGIGFHGDSSGRIQGLAVELALFRTDAQDLIQLLAVPSRTVKAFNVGEARIIGLEASLSFRLNGLVTAAANYTRQKAEDRSDTFQFGGDLPGRPREEASTSLSLDLKYVSLTHRFTFVGENEVASLGLAAGNLVSSRQSLTRLPSRYLHDFALEVPIAGTGTLSFELVNAFDRLVVDIARFPLPGRMFLVKLRGRF